MKAVHEKPIQYYRGCNQKLVEAVPKDAMLILEVGCADGRLGGLLKEIDPRRRVFGVEYDREAAARAATRLDRVIHADVEKEELNIEPGSLDCILYGDVLEHLVDPLRVLSSHRKFLKPEGLVLCSVPNIQHHSIFKALATGDFQYTQMGLLDETHLRFFSGSTFFKLLLDAGFVPAIKDAYRGRVPTSFLRSLAPFLHRVGVDADWAGEHLRVYQYIFSGYLDKGFQFDSRSAVEPLSFVVAVNDQDRLKANLLSSPCLAKGTPHEMIEVRNQRSAAEVFNQGITRARCAMIVWVHQDVYLPEGWTARFSAQMKSAKARASLGVAGVYGVDQAGGKIQGAGRILDRQNFLEGGSEFPVAARTLDEVLLAVPRDTALRFDPKLGFHFYGADICLEARRRNLSVLAVDAPCFHNSLGGLAPPDEFYASGYLLAQKWKSELPIATTCAIVDENWKRTRPQRSKWIRQAERAGKFLLESMKQRRRKKG